MKKILFYIGLMVSVCMSNQVRADLFGAAKKELQERFIVPLIDMRNTAENTAKILKATRDTQDRVRVAGGFIDQMSDAIAKLVDSLTYINDTYVSSFLSKDSHKKIKELASYAQSFVPVAHEVASTLKKYERPKMSKEIADMLDAS